MVVVDPRFPTLMRDLRHDSGLSLRELAVIVHYSHSYLWEIETGRKLPTAEIAGALDGALSAGGMLAELVTSELDSGTATEPLVAAMEVLETHRGQVQEMAAAGWLPDSSQDARQVAARWARLAAWLYEALVRSRPPLMRWGASRYSQRLRRETGASPFRMEALAQGRVARVECTSISEKEAPADVAAALMLKVGDLVVWRENRYFADDEPVQLGTTYIPLHVAGKTAALRSRALGRGSLYARFEDIGHAPVRIREVVSVRLPTPTEAERLRIAATTPVFEVVHTSYDSQHQPFEATRFTIRTDRTVLNFEMPVED